MERKAYSIVRYADVDDGDGMTIGVCFDRELAKRFVSKLQDQNNNAVEHWEKYASKCICNCESWKTSDDPGLVENLDVMAKFNCPRKKNVHAGELILGENESGGYEIWCDGRDEGCEYPDRCTYIVQETVALTEADLETITERV